MNSIQSYVQQGRHTLRRWVLNPKAHTALRAGLHILSGFLLSAASLAQSPLPLAMGLMCACTGWSAVFVGVGSAVGYLLFWSTAGEQAVAWLGAGLVFTLLLGHRRLTQTAPLLLPAISGLIVAVCGVLFQMLDGRGVSVPVYLIQIAFAVAVTWLLTLVLQSRNPILDWLACGLAVLALAQIVPIPYFGLGYLAAGALCTASCAGDARSHDGSDGAELPCAVFAPVSQIHRPPCSRGGIHSGDVSVRTV